MIAIDTSALLSIAFGEDDATIFLGAMKRGACIVGAPTAFETMIVAAGRASTPAGHALDGLPARPNPRMVQFEADHVALARAAFASYGKGQGHPAQLNFGDGMAYAIAERTGLRPALA